MTLAIDRRMHSGLVDDLLALPTLDQRLAFLHDADLLNADGLDRLLDIADRLAFNDPGKAHRLAAVCADVADLAAAPATVPPNYIWDAEEIVNENCETNLGTELPQ